MSTARPNPPETPNERELALHEIRSLTEQMRASNLHVYSTKDFRRDRVLGWLFLAVILAAIGGLTWWNLLRSQDTRDSLYRSCTQGNVERASQQQVYRDIASLTNDARIKVRLEQAASDLRPRDCAALYLR